MWGGYWLNGNPKKPETLLPSRNGVSDHWCNCLPRVRESNVTWVINIKAPRWSIWATWCDCTFLMFCPPMESVYFTVYNKFFREEKIVLLQWKILSPLEEADNCELCLSLAYLQANDLERISQKSLQIKPCSGPQTCLWGLPVSASSCWSDIYNPSTQASW